MEFARRKRTLFATLVPLLLWLFGDPSPRSFIDGLIFIAIGQGIRIWSAGCIRKNRDVATGGPYAFVRNPLYLGSFILSIGFAVMADRWWAYAVVAAQFLFFYHLAILSEEKYLRASLGAPYRDYADAVPRFWPNGRQYPKSEGGFDWTQVQVNREYRSYIPVLVLCFLFAMKAWTGIDPVLLLRDPQWRIR